MITRCYSCMERFDSKYRVCPHCGQVVSETPQEPYQLAPGTILQGRYIIGNVLDYGGFGTVYKAWDNVLQIVVAIKEFYPAGIVQRVPGTMNLIILEGHKDEYAKGLERFLSEAVITTKFVENENIVDVLTYFELNNTAYIIMEFLEGCSLSAYLEKYGKMESDIAVNVLLSVINALKDVHKAGILHRDISPSNIFLGKDGIVKLIDFGAARAIEDVKDDIDIELKPGYAPPEQYQSNRVQGPWSDIYALGATLYKTITGEIPEESINRTETDTLIRPRTIDNTIPKYLDKTLMRSMAVPTELRFKSVEEFEKAIQNKRRVKTPEKELRKRKRRRVTGVVLLVLIILGISGYAYARYRIEKMNEVLPATTLEICMVADTFAERGYKKQKFEDLCSEFKQDNPQVQFEYVFYPSDTYKDEISKAAILGDTPDLFEACDLPYDIQMIAAHSPTELYELIDESEYYVLEENKDYILEYRRVPIGLNTRIEVLNNELIKTFNAPMNNNPVLFINGKTPVALLTIDEYYTAREKLSGRYSLVENAFVDYSYEYCIGFDSNIGNRTCVVRLLYYLLGDTAQEKLYTTYKDNLPIKKNVFDEFVKTNLEITYIKDYLENHEDIPENLDFNKEYVKTLNNQYTDLNNTAKKENE